METQKWEAEEPSLARTASWLGKTVAGPDYLAAAAWCTAAAAKEPMAAVPGPDSGSCSGRLGDTKMSPTGHSTLEGAVGLLTGMLGPQWWRPRAAELL